MTSVKTYTHFQELRQKVKEDRPQSPSTEIKEQHTKRDYTEVGIQACPDRQEMAIQTSPESAGKQIELHVVISR